MIHTVIKVKTLILAPNLKVDIISTAQCNNVNCKSLILLGSAQKISHRIRWCEHTTM